MSKKNQVSISYIIPTYNGEAYIGILLDFLLKHIEMIDEVIVINDGSTDATSEVVRNLVDERITFFDMENNKGVSFSRNTGIENAKKDYLVFLDSDDSLSPDFFKDIKRIISEYEFPNVIRFSNSRYIGNWPDKAVLLTNLELIESGYSDSYFLHSSVTQAIAKDFIIKEGVHFRTDLEYAEDLLFSFLLIHKAKEILVLPQKYYVYNYDENSVSNTSKYEVILKRIDGTNKVYSNIISLVGEEYRKIFEKKYRRELSMQLMKLYYSDVNVFNEIYGESQSTLKKLSNYQLNFLNVYDVFWMLSVKDIFPIWIRRVFLNVYVNLYKVKNRNVKL